MKESFSQLKELSPEKPIRYYVSNDYVEKNYDHNGREVIIAFDASHPFNGKVVMIPPEYLEDFLTYTTSVGINMINIADTSVEKDKNLV